MPLIKTRVVLCDVCGLEIDGDYLEVRYSLPDGGWAKFYVHNPRTAALDPCGNNILEALKKLFPHSDHA
jgi:hypothetical protein